MTAIREYLDNPLVLVGICAIAGGIVLVLLAWAFTGEYEKGGYEPRHRASAGEPEPVADVRPFVPATETRHHHRFAGAPDEGTRRLYPTTYAARSRVVTIGPEGIERGNHAGETGRLRPSQKEHVEEEGGADRERRQDEGGTVGNGEEGGAHAEAAQALTDCPVAGWYRNTDTGEIRFFDEHGRAVDWASE